MIDAQDPIGLDERWQGQIRPVQRAHLRFYQICGAIGVFVLIAFLAFKLVPGESDDFILNAVTEGLGILATVLVLGSFNVWFSERQRKQELIVQMSSQSNDFALMAVKLLRVNGWLNDGSLRGADLRDANLQKADLSGADLQGAALRYANLQSSNLKWANLQRSDLTLAQLQNANLEWGQLQNACLFGARLQEANLMNVQLQHAILIFANLQGANLWEANLRGAILEDNTFDETTTLPDGMKWHKDVDMSRFTNPKHLEFFEANNPAEWEAVLERVIRQRED